MNDSPIHHKFVLHYTPYNQNYRRALYLAICSKNTINGIINWRFWVLYGKKLMLAVYIKIDDHYVIRQAA